MFSSASDAPCSATISFFPSRRSVLGVARRGDEFCAEAERSIDFEVEGNARFAQGKFARGGSP